jgi:signal-transduction protein with cAMP-binding, CBS, and nucleotidyltransferase domain
MNTGYSVSDVLVKDVFNIDRHSSIEAAAKNMKDHKIGSLIIIEMGKPVGIITEQDIARKVVAEELDAKESKVNDIMSTDLKTIEASEDIHEAMHQMGQNEVKHLIVFNEGSFEGIVTFKDIIQVMPSLIELVEFKKLSKSEDDFAN